MRNAQELVLAPALISKLTQTPYTMNKRFFVKVRKFKMAAKKNFGFFPPEDPTGATFTKRYPKIQVEDLTVKHQTQLTPKEKLFFVEKEFHALRFEIGENQNSGKLTREQIFRLCLYKREMDAVKSGEIY
jgi:hypothetical protein